MEFNDDRLLVVAALVSMVYIYMWYVANKGGR